MASLLHTNLDSQGGKVLSPDRAIAEAQTLLLDPGSLWIDNPPTTIGRERIARRCCLRGYSEATTRSVITTPASEDFSGFRFLCSSPQVNPTEERWDTRWRTSPSRNCLLMADLEGVFWMRPNVVSCSEVFPSP